jgi:predicted kinase
MYHPDQSARVYAKMAEDARHVLGSGRSAIVESSFSKRSERERFRRLAAQFNAEPFFIECRLSDEAARVRLARRATSGGVSDGRLEIYDSFREAYQAPTESEFRRHLVLDTERPEAEQHEVLRAFLS